MDRSLISADTGMVLISRFSSEREEKQVSQENVIFSMLAIKWLPMINLLAHLKQLTVSLPDLAG